MKIEELTLREIRIRLRNPFETSFGTTWDRRILLVEARCDGVTGWGEVTAGEGPFYNSETTDTAWAIFRKFVAPLVLGKSIPAAASVLQLLEPIRGHEMTKAALENALGTSKPSKRELRSPSCSTERARRFPAACHSAFARIPRNCSPPLKENWPMATSASKSKSSPTKTSNSSRRFANAFLR
jgi:hypothetical protein